MGLFLDAANAWNDLHNTRYILDIAKKCNLQRIELSFPDEDFPHLSGIHYAKDIDFGINKAEYYGKKLIPTLLSKRIDDTIIETSQNWNKISGRLTAIKNLQATLDGNFIIASFNRLKVRGYSQIDAKFAIKSTISDDVYFVFLDNRDGNYYCKSAFKKSLTDYFENQTIMTLLQKTKIINGVPDILYTKDGYTPDSK